MCCHQCCQSCIPQALLSTYFLYPLSALLGRVTSPILKIRKLRFREALTCCTSSTWSLLASCANSACPQCAAPLLPFTPNPRLCLHHCKFLPHLQWQSISLQQFCHPVNRLKHDWSDKESFVKRKNNHILDLYVRKNLFDRGAQVLATHSYPNTDTFIQLFIFGAFAGPELLADTSNYLTRHKIERGKKMNWGHESHRHPGSFCGCKWAYDWVITANSSQLVGTSQCWKFLMQFPKDEIVPFPHPACMFLRKQALGR